MRNPSRIQAQGVVMTLKGVSVDTRPKTNGWFTWKSGKEKEETIDPPKDTIFFGVPAMSFFRVCIYS